MPCGIALLCVLLLVSQHLVSGSIMAPGNIRMSASITDRSVHDLSSLNLNVAMPFKVKDYVVGFKSALSDLKKVPERLFVKKTFETGLEDAKLTVDAQYRLGDHNVEVAARLSSDEHAASLFVDGDIANKLKNVEVRKQTNLNDFKISMLGGYNALKRRFNFVGGVGRSGTSAAVQFDTETQDPLLAVTQAVNVLDVEVTPSVYAKSRLFGCALTRRWTAGYCTSKISSDRKALFEWRDETLTGAWVTSAEMSLPPVMPGSSVADATAQLLSIPTRLTVSRDWRY